MKKKLIATLLAVILTACMLTPCACALMHGDADADNQVTPEDARLALRASVGLLLLDKTMTAVSDCDGDNAVTPEDARAILRAAVRLDELKCTSFTTVNYGSETKQFCVVCGKERTATPAEQLKLEEGTDEQPKALSQQLTITADTISKRYGATAVQAAVIDNGAVSSFYQYGVANLMPQQMVTENTKFRVASLSKLVVAIVFMALADRGIVSDKEDISSYFGYLVRNPYYPSVAITPEMIFTHTASYDDDGFSRYLAEGGLKDEDLYYDVKPGTEYAYSNYAYGILYCICEKATGKTFDALAKQYVFDPLGIDAAFYAGNIQAQSELGALYGEDGGLTVAEWLDKKPSEQLGATLALACGNLGISAVDYAKLICAMLNGGMAPNGIRVLSPESVNTICSSHFRESFYGVGYGTQLETTVLPGKTVLVHTGSAYGMFAAYAFCPAENKGVVVLTTGCARRLDDATDVYSVCLDMIRALYP